MRINDKRHTVDMEIRDINYILPAYVRSYQYYMKGELPKEIIFPMFPAVMSRDGVAIPIRYIDISSPEAVEIAKDGSNVPEIAEEPIEESMIEEEPTKEDKVDEPVVAEEPPKESKAKEALKNIQKTKEREPKMPPGGDIGHGHPDDIGREDPGFARKIASDLRPEAAVDESKEIPTEIEKQQ